MPSYVEIINRSLILLESPRRITSLTDNTVEAIVMNSIYEQVRDEELSKNAWQFAKKRAALAASVDTPVYGWDYKYPLPSDYAHLLEVDEVIGDEYTIEENCILTNESGPLYITYCRKGITDPSIFSPLFVGVYAAQLAATACEQITQSTEKLKLLIIKYDDLVREARRYGAIVEPPKDLRDGTWLTSRI